MRLVKQALSTLRETLVVDQDDEDEDEDAQLRVETLKEELVKLTSSSGGGATFQDNELNDILTTLERDNKLMYRGGVIHLI
jgi:hypothetical protein